MPLRLILNLHCHQPVGNFGWVLEHATARCYRPLLQTCARHPRVRMTWHVSGPLLEWWSERAPDLVDLLRSGVERGQYEIQCSGLYEPILVAIPERDRRAQIRLHQSWMEDWFGGRPDSLWLTERVWEPALPGTLQAEGVRSLPVDDHHFLAAGLRGPELDGYHVTEEEGRAVAVFPISTRLRYLIPFRPVKEVLGFLRERHDAGQSLLVFGDDGEKFGVWPGTEDWVFGKGWLEEFLSALSGAGGWLTTVSYAEALGTLGSKGLVYLPATSYPEMDRWCLPVEAQKTLHRLEADLETSPGWPELQPFLRGTLWRNMLSRYPEANRLHKRMLQVSDRVQEEEGDAPDRPGQLSAARRALYRAQCNCAYWHGVFGGVYLPFLRDALYDELLAAERALGARRGSAGAADLDRDGADEVWLRGGPWNLWISPARGGVIELLEHSGLRRNLVNVVSRREEAYHAELREPAAPPDDPDDPRDADATEPRSIHHPQGSLRGDTTDLWRYDHAARGAFAVEVCLQRPDLSEMAFLDQLSPDAPSRSPWQIHAPPSPDRGCVLTLEREDWSLVRSYRIEGDSLLAELTVTARRSLRTCWLIQRCDWSAPMAGSPERHFLAGGERMDPARSHAFRGSKLHLRDDRGTLELACSRSYQAALVPLWVAVRSESGPERSQQGTTLLLGHELSLGAGESAPVTLRLSSTRGP